LSTPPAPGHPQAGPSTVKRALGAIERLQARLEAAERAATEAIAIVGLSCRFPGADSPDQYWRLLADGVDAITEVPAERWDIARYFDPDPDARGKMYTRHGGFLQNVAGFDSWFFRISPREAQSLDPQHRLLLEVAWEAFEDAGMAADSLRGSDTGVFVGITTNDYAQLLMRQDRELDAFFFTGNPTNAAAGRLAYSFGLSGPALSIDTACSSSLVSVHQACASLRAGECRSALAGGVNLVLTPENTIAVCKTRALSPEGRCKTFDRSADGFVRSEGCGLVVLKRLSDAIADGDPIRAVIRGSAVNQDGASGGFTVPNGQAQQAVIRRALGTIAPSEIDYLEAHGTGTPLGDPIEVTAAAAVLSKDREASRPLYIGSVKTNIGHCEAAAGVAALIKTVLAVEHAEIPAHLHFQEPNPLIPWDTLAVRVPSVATPWPTTSHPRRAGVSAFGASGTNAHVVIEQAPGTPVSARTTDRSHHVLVLSAKRRDALTELIARYRERLQAGDVNLADVCYSAAAGRAHHPHRIAVVARSTEEAVAALDAARSRMADDDTASDQDAVPRTPRIAFLFTGQGSQYRGMGRVLYDTQPVFRDAIDRCAAILAARLDSPLQEVLFGPGDRLDDTRFTQPGLFAIEYALATMLGAWGIRPSVVIGHSVGEYAAACVAGVFSLEDALTLVAERGRLMGNLPRDGAMTAVAADEATVLGAMSGLEADLSIAAVNAPKSVVLSGRTSAMATAVKRLTDAGVRSAALTVSHAFHSPLMDPMLGEFDAAARTVTYASPVIPWISNLTGRPMTDAPDAEYWRRHCREAVRFADGVDAIVEHGCDILLEIGPRPTLVRLAAQCRPDASRRGLALLSPGEDDWRVVLDAVATLYSAGVNPDWREFDRPFARRHVALPTYPFQRKHYWISQKAESMPNPEQPTRAANAPPRRDAVLGVLRKYIAELLQAPESEINIHLPFLEMGADSLVMVDAIGLVEKEFGLKLAIRRFFEDLSTIDALAGFIDSSLPEDGAPVETAAASAPSVAAQIPMVELPAGATPFERIFAEQTRMMTQLMAQQAEIVRLALGGNAAAAAAAPAPVRTAAVAAKPAAAPADVAKPMMPFGNPIEIRARGLTETQHQHLEALISRYTERTRLSKQRTQENRAVLADSRATVGFRLSTKEMLYPIWGSRSAGSRVWDIDGNEYIDYTMGFGVHLFGHKPAFVQSALRDDLERAVELGARSDLVGEVATLFTGLTGLDRVAFSNSGTEAVMAAVRLARAKTGRDKICIFTNAYHGHADTTLARAQNSNGQMMSVPMAPGVPGSIAADIVCLDYGSDEALEIIRKRGHEFAAVMVEPVQSRHLKQQPRAFLQELRTITREVGAALIFDEMITGFRADIGGAQAYFGVKADLATYGKIVGGGMPIGLVAGSAEYMDGVDGGMWQYGDGSFPAADRTAFGGTFCQHPLSMTAALAVLRHMADQGPALQQRLNDRTNRLVRGLNDYFRAEEVPIEATNFSSLFRFEFSSNLDLLFYHMLERGIYIWEWRSCFLSTAHSDDDIQRFVDVVQESVSDLRRGGFAPRSVSASAGHATASTTTAPMSQAQKQLWLLLQIEKTSSIAYNVSTTLELQGQLDLDHLRAALERVIERHSALRTTIAPDGSHQVIHEPWRIEIPITDLSKSADREQALAGWREQVSREPIDLVRGPAFRPQLVRLADDRHVLMLSAHHILADGMTMGVIMKELAAFYNERIAGKSSSHPAPMQFRDYVALCEQHRDTPAMKEHEAFWIDQFKDGVPQLDLPLDRPRPSIKTYTGGRVSQQIGPEIVQAVKRVSREHGCTLNMTLLSAFALLLHRYAGQDDLVVGTSVSGRPFPGSMDMAGYCTHLVPVRSQPDADPSFSDLLRGMKRRLLDVFDHQDLPFAELLQKLPAARTAGAFPLISAVFNLEPVSALPQLQGLKTSLLPQSVSFTPFDLFVNVTDAGDSLIVDADFNADLFEAATVDRMMQSFETLLRGAIESPKTSARLLPLLTAEQRQQIVVNWNDTARTYPADARVHVMFESRAASTPDAIAVEFEGTHVSYRALNARANQLAHWLRSRGVGADVLVGICCERSIDMVTAIIGVLKAGGAYVPIDPEYPADRVEFMLKDANVPIVLTQSRCDARLGSYAGERLRLDADASALDKLDTGNPKGDIAPDQLAYMIYTSGSTGRPKGAMNTHRGIANRLLWMQNAYGLTAGDRVLQKTPFSFDVSVWEFLWPLMMGARLVMARPGGHRDAGYLADTIARAQITTIHFVPSMLHAFLEEPLRDRCGSLTRVICSGEALSPELVRRFKATLDVPLYNLYGPTEAAVDVTAWTCDLDQLQSNVPIGKPIANTQIYLLDRRMQPVPVGVTGELFIGGTNVGRGYLNRPELTAERFIADPFSTTPGARLYRTGDLARFRPDGNIEYLGRIDNQVKIRGFRIELGEIEAALLDYPGVSRAVVVAQDTAAGDKRLVGYVAAAPAGGLDAALRMHLLRTLPDYMVPSAFVALDAIPLLPNGKIDRSRLPGVVTTGAHVPPAAGLESAIAAIWEEVLRQAPIGATDDFFALGGNSLSASQVVSRVGRQLETRIGIKDMFTYPTIRALAGEMARASGRDLPAVTALAPQPHYEVSHAERRFWIQDRLADPSKGNSHPASFLIEGPLDVAALQQAFRALVARHEILRTVFIEVGGQPRQQVIAADRFEFTLTETALAGERDLTASIAAIERQAAASRMDLAKGPLFRAQLVKLGADRHVCVCSMHHTITDGWSVGVLLNDLSALYDGLVAGTPAALPALTIQYKDYSAWHNAITTGHESDPMRAYWKSKLTGDIPALPLPADHPRGAAYVRAVRRFTIDRPLADGLQSIARQQGGTLFMALLSCIKVLLYRHTGQQDICVGTPVSARTQPELELQIGAYLNILALRDAVSGDDSLASVLHAVRETTLDAFANQLYPFDRIIEDLKVKRVPGRNPLFDVGFTLQNQDDVHVRENSRHLRITEMRRDDEAFDDQEAATDLWFIARNDDGRLAVQVVYNAALFKPERVDGFARDLVTIASAAVENLDTRVKAVALGSGGRPQATRKITIDLGL